MLLHNRSWTNLLHAGKQHHALTRKKEKTTKLCLPARGCFVSSHAGHTLHSCWPWDSSSKGYRWLHLVQAYRADVAILAAKLNVTELEEAVVSFPCSLEAAAAPSPFLPAC